MSEPSEAVYEAAAVARILARIPGTSVGAAKEVLANELTRPLWLDRDLIAAVDAVWPLAEVEGRRQAAEAILTKGREFHPATLRAQLMEAAARIAARPPVTFTHPCGHSQVSPIPHLCPQCAPAEPWS